MAEDRMGALEARLATLKRKMEAGLAERATRLRDMAARLEAGDGDARRALKTEGHKLRGIAGTYAHEELGDKAAELEQRASVSPPPVLGTLARELADLAEAAAQQSTRSERPSMPPPRPEGVTAEQQTRSDRPTTTADDGLPLRVLAMDDDPVMLRLLMLTLNEVGGFRATIVDSASEALALLEGNDFDVIVSDAMMPDMNGREFCERARALGKTIPIVILSAASPDELGWAPLADGPSAWLRKPFRPTLLVHELARIVEEHRG
jgi:CheY-like chemotaxis protein